MAEMSFDYFYGDEVNQFAFYRIPKAFFKDLSLKQLSAEAKSLYGLMLDRLSLSIKNGWYDKNRKVYIVYMIEKMADDLGCSKGTAIKVRSELEKVGLIEKVRRGLGKTDIIYVKKFYIDSHDAELSEDSILEYSEGQEKDFSNSNDDSSVSTKTITEDIQNLCCNNNTNTNNTDISYSATRPHITPPSFEEVEKYCFENNCNVNPKRFWHYYNARGWLINNEPIHNWKSLIKSWENNSEYQNKISDHQKSFVVDFRQTDLSNELTDIENLYMDQV